MRVLIIGFDTPVGQALGRLFTQREREFVGLKRSDCRWKRERQAKKSLRRSACDMVIDLRVQAAADGGVKVHESDIERSRWLAQSAQGSSIPLMALSCARVFSGEGGQPYREEDSPDVDTSIAELLVNAEAAVREHCERHFILRMGPVFAPSGINVVTYMLHRLDANEVLYLDRDNRGCPVAAEDAAWVISAVVDQCSCGVEAWGDYHYCSADITSCYEFGEVLLAAASQYRDLQDDVVREKTESLALNRKLDCSKIRDTFAIRQQFWRSSVAGHVKQYYAESEAAKP
ncbi:MAG: sugar nucleotide-binding protein [Halieaceae bacterium]|nr:sugar nucleotide-binding protein [Halieaceae bacterium]